jgi:hypothetical protein
MEMILKILFIGLILAVAILAISGDHLYNIGKKFVGIFYNYPKEESKNEEEKNEEEKKE